MPRKKAARKAAKRTAAQKTATRRLVALNKARARAVLGLRMGDGRANGIHTRRVTKRDVMRYTTDLASVFGKRRKRRRSTSAVAALVAAPKKRKPAKRKKATTTRPATKRKAAKKAAGRKWSDERRARYWATRSRAYAPVMSPEIAGERARRRTAAAHAQQLEDWAAQSRAYAPIRQQTELEMMADAQLASAAERELQAQLGLPFAAGLPANRSMRPIASTRPTEALRADAKKKGKKKKRRAASNPSKPSGWWIADVHGSGRHSKAGKRHSLCFIGQGTQAAAEANCQVLLKKYSAASVELSGPYRTQPSPHAVRR